MKPDADKAGKAISPGTVTWCPSCAGYLTASATNWGKVGMCWAYRHITSLGDIWVTASTQKAWMDIDGISISKPFRN